MRREVLLIGNLFELEDESVNHFSIILISPSATKQSSIVKTLLVPSRVAILFAIKRGELACE